MMVMLDAFFDFCAGTLYLLVLGAFCVGLMFFTEWILNKIRKHR
jgi:hypothetical protein